MAEQIEVFRDEKKFYITRLEAAVLEKKLSEVLRYDMDGKEYMVRSVYFDDCFSKDFWATQYGDLVRKKIRIRCYRPDEDPVKLEVKNKAADKQLKQTVLIPAALAREMISGQYDGLLDLNDKLANEVYYYLKKSSYRPAATVEYNRSAFVYDNFSVRITFDSEIKISETDFDIFNEQMLLYPACTSDFVLMELKYNQFLPEFIKRMLKDSNLVSTAFSKYCMSRVFINEYFF